MTINIAIAATSASLALLVVAANILIGG